MREKPIPKLEKCRSSKGPLASTSEMGNYGHFQIPIGKRALMFVVSSDSDETGWEHVSVHVRYLNKKRKVTVRTPTWEEMCLIKDLFWSEEETVIQFHPPKSEYVNNHPHCLHLWKQTGVNQETPPSILTGIKPLSKQP